MYPTYAKLQFIIPYLHTDKQIYLHNGIIYETIQNVKRLVATLVLRMPGCDLSLKRLLASLSKGVEVIRALVYQCHGGSYALTSSHTALGLRLHSNSSSR